MAMAGFEQWLAELYGHLSYGHIILLMAMEASLFPVPAELVILPAGYLARQGQLDPVLAALSGTLGSLIGASVNYLLGRYVGRVLLLKYGKYFLIREHQYRQAETLFLRSAVAATFFGRLVPIIRHLISLPAGVFGMHWLSFILATASGAGLLCASGVALGYYYGEAAVQALHAHMVEMVVVTIAVPFAYLAVVLLRRPRPKVV